jgi:hypothetical protein
MPHTTTPSVDPYYSAMTKNIEAFQTVFARYYYDQCIYVNDDQSLY